MVLKSWRYLFTIKFLVDFLIRVNCFFELDELHLIKLIDGNSSSRLNLNMVGKIHEFWLEIHTQHLTICNHGLQSLDL